MPDSACKEVTNYQNSDKFWVAIKFSTNGAVAIPYLCFVRPPNIYWQFVFSLKDCKVWEKMRSILLWKAVQFLTVRINASRYFHSIDRGIMAFKLQILSKESLLLGYGTGLILPEELHAIIPEVLSQPEFRPGLDRLIVIEEPASVSKLNSDELESIRLIVRNAELQDSIDTHNPGHIKFRTAIVCTDSIKIVIAKLYQALWASDPLADVKIEIFPSKREALLWLNRANLQLPASSFRAEQ